MYELGRTGQRVAGGAADFDTTEAYLEDIEGQVPESARSYPLRGDVVDSPPYQFRRCNSFHLSAVHIYL